MQVRGGFATEDLATVAERSRALRDARYEARGVLHEFSSLKRVKLCGRVSVRPAGTVDVRHTGDIVGLSGMGVCGSVWACPVCSAKIAAKRHVELRQLMEAVENAGYEAWFETMTLRHCDGQSLQQLYDALSTGHTRVRTDRAVRDLRAELDFFGYVRVVEVTVSRENGWHPHIHQVLIFKRELSEIEGQKLADVEFEVWKRAAKRAGLGEPLRGLFDMQRVAGPIEDYLAKSVYLPGMAVDSVAHEMATGAVTKRAKGGSRSAFQLLEDFSQWKEARDLELWHEYEQATHGRHQMSWSQGLKRWAHVGEVSDEEIAQEEVGTDADVIFALLDAARDLRGPGRAGLVSRMMTAIEQGGTAAGLAFCEEWGIETAPADHPLAVYDRVAHARRFSEARAERARLDAEQTLFEWQAAVDALDGRLGPLYGKRHLLRRDGDPRDELPAVEREIVRVEERLERLRSRRPDDSAEAPEGDDEVDEQRVSEVLAYFAARDAAAGSFSPPASAGANSLSTRAERGSVERVVSYSSVEGEG